MTLDPATLEAISNTSDGVSVTGDAVKALGEGSWLGTLGEVGSGLGSLVGGAITTVQGFTGSISTGQVAINYGEIVLIGNTPPPGDIALGASLLASKVIPQVVQQGIQDAVDNEPVNPPSTQPGVNMGDGLYWQEEFPY